MTNTGFKNGRRFVGIDASTQNYRRIIFLVSDFPKGGDHDGKHDQPHEEGTVGSVSAAHANMRYWSEQNNILICIIDFVIVDAPCSLEQREGVMPPEVPPSISQTNP